MNRMDEKLLKLIALRKAVDWKILEEQGHNMSLVYYLGDKHANDPLYMRAAGCLCTIEYVIKGRANKGFVMVKILHPWDSHGLSKDSVGHVLPVHINDTHRITMSTKEVKV
jgi:hypothetical protein